MHKYGTIAVIDTLLFTKKQTKTRDREECSCVEAAIASNTDAKVPVPRLSSGMQSPPAATNKIAAKSAIARPLCLLS